MSDSEQVNGRDSDANFYEAPIMHGLVRVLRNDASGTGTVIGRRWINAYALTSAHVVRTQPTVRVRPLCLPQSAPTKACVVARDPHADLAMVRFRSASDLPVIPVSPFVFTPTWYELCLCMDWHEADRPLIVETTCVGTRDYPADPRSLCVLTDRKGFPGRSGSPLLARGFCIGICYGSVGAKGIYVSLQEIHPKYSRGA